MGSTWINALRGYCCSPAWPALKPILYGFDNFMEMSSVVAENEVGLQ